MREQLEAAITAAPDVPAPYLALAEFLETQNDAQAELISVMHALEHETDPSRFVATRARRDALLVQHAQTWLDGLAPTDMQWQWGFVKAAKLRRASDVGRLFNAPAGRFVRSLSLELAAYEFAGARRAFSWPTVRHVTLRCVSDEPLDVAEACAGAAQLERLRLDAPGASVPTHLPRLKELRLRVSDPSALMEGPFPSLYELDLRQPQRDVAWLARVLTPQRFPALKRLTLEHDDTDALLQALPAWPLITQLHALTVTGPFTDKGVEAVLQQSPRLAKLAFVRFEAGRTGTTVRKNARRLLPLLQLVRDVALKTDAW